MEIIIMIVVIFVVLSFLPKKKNNYNSIDNETLNQISDLVYNDIFLSWVWYAKILKIIVDKYNIKCDEDNFYFIDDIFKKVKEYQKIDNHWDEINEKLNLLINILPKIDILQKDWDINYNSQETLEWISLLSVLYNYILTQKRPLDIDTLEKAKNWITTIFKKSEFNSDDYYNRLISVFVTNSLDDMQKVLNW